MFEDGLDDSLFSSRAALDHEIMYYGVAGTNAEGLIPESIQEECQIALAKMKYLLEKKK